MSELASLLAPRFRRRARRAHRPRPRGADLPRGLLVRVAAAAPSGSASSRCWPAPPRLPRSTTLVPWGPLGYHLTVRARRSEVARVSARVLFACWPFEGHVFPQLSVALARRERGERGRLLHRQASAERRSTRRRVELFPFDRVEGVVAARARARARGAAARGSRCGCSARRSASGSSRRSPAQVADLRAVIADWRPDVIVADGSMWGPSLILHEATPDPGRIRLDPALRADPGPRRPASGLAHGSAAQRAPGARSRRGISAATDLLARGTRARVDELRAGYGLPPLGCSVNEFWDGCRSTWSASIPELDYMPARPARERALRRPAACGIRPSRRTRSTWLARVPRATYRGCT